MSRASIASANSWLISASVSSASIFIDPLVYSDSAWWRGLPGGHDRFRAGMSLESQSRHAGSIAVVGRGRDASYPTPPAQTRAGAINAHGSYLGYVWRQSAP